MLRLPAELRNTVFEYVVGGKDIWLCLRRGKPLGTVKPLSTPPEIFHRSPHVFRKHDLVKFLAACRQVYVDARYLAITTNVISSADVDTFHKWLRARPYYVSLFRTLRTYTRALGKPSKSHWVRDLKHLVNIRRVEVCAWAGRRKTGAIESLHIVRLEDKYKAMINASTDKEVEVIFYHEPSRTSARATTTAG